MYLRGRHLQLRRGPRRSTRRRRPERMTRVNLVLLAVLVACALSLVTSRHQARKLTTELSRAEAQACAFDVEFGRLTLEQWTWAMPARVDKLAREQRLQSPAAARVVVVEMPEAAR